MIRIILMSLCQHKSSDEYAVSVTVPTLDAKLDFSGMLFRNKQYVQVARILPCYLSR